MAKKNKRIVPTRAMQARWLIAEFPNLQVGDTRSGTRGNRLFTPAVAEAVRRYLVGNRCLFGKGPAYQLTPYGRKLAIKELGIRKPPANCRQQKKMTVNAKPAKISEMESGGLLSLLCHDRAEPGNPCTPLTGLKRGYGNENLTRRESLLASLLQGGYLNAGPGETCTITAKGCRVMNAYRDQAARRAQINRQIILEYGETTAPIPDELLLERLKKTEARMIEAGLAPELRHKLWRRIQETENRLAQTDHSSKESKAVESGPHIPTL